jgi:hypothetical protein
VRKLISPVDLGGLNDKEVGAYVDSLSGEQRFSYAQKLNLTERLRIGDACDRIPLAIRWILSRAHSAAEAVTSAEALTTVPRNGEILLEFSFRRVFDGMSDDERRVLQCESKPSVVMRVSTLAGRWLDLEMALTGGLPAGTATTPAIAKRNNRTHVKEPGILVTRGWRREPVLIALCFIVRSPV